MPPRPAASCDPSAAPDGLRRHRQWVVWQYQPVNDKWTKVPMCVRGGKASTTDSSTWGSFEEAVAAWEAGGFDGIGFVFTADDGLCGVDFDECRNEQGRIAPEAQAFIDAFGSYSEVSPSGTGVKIILVGRKPAGAGCKSKALPGLKQTEVYDSKRYFTITGQQLAGTPAEVRDGQAALDALCARLWPPRAERDAAAEPTRQRRFDPAGACPTPDPAADDTIIARLRKASNGPKFEALFDRGDISRYDNDESSADAALCCHLAFYTRDPAQIERIFDRSALAGRDKWRDRPDYRQRTIDSALGYVTGSATPARALQAAAGTAEPNKPPPCTDLGNAERFAARCNQTLRYCHATGMWYAWNGRCWRRDEVGTPLLEAGRTARAMLTDAAACENESARAQLAKWALESEARPRLEAMVALARSHPDLAITTDRLDRDIWAFNTLNGTVDLRTGLIRPHDRDDLITKVAPVEYDPDAACPLWKEFLERIMGGDAALIGYVQRFFGYCLSGGIDLQYLPILHGVGANGKSVFVDTVKAIMGEYACDAPPSLLVRSGRDEHPTEIADLMGRRLVVASETEDGAAFKLQFVKRLTGDATLKGRFMRQDFFSFARTHKTVLVTNNKPRVAEDSEAVWRRLHLVPFEVVIPEQERDAGLLEKLRDEWPGILGWLVRGCLACQQHGLAPPEAVSAATAEYRAAEDSLGRFFEECCEIDPEGTPDDERSTTPFSAIYAAYKQHCEAGGEHALGTRRFAAALDKRGLPGGTARYAGHPAKVRYGIQIVHTPCPPWRPGP